MTTIQGRMVASPSMDLQEQKKQHMQDEFPTDKFTEVAFLKMLLVGH